MTYILFYYPADSKKEKEKNKTANIADPLI